MIVPGNVLSFWAKTEKPTLPEQGGGDTNCMTVTFRFCTTCMIYLIFDLATLIIGEVKKFKALSVQVHAHVTCSCLGPSILRNILCCTLFVKRAYLTCV
jgi:hypothetical protein